MGEVRTEKRQQLNELKKDQPKSTIYTESYRVLDSEIKWLPKSLSQ